MLKWITIILLILNLLFTVATRYNDMKHMEKNLNEIIIKVDDISTRVATIEGYLKGKE